MNRGVIVASCRAAPDRTSAQVSWELIELSIERVRPRLCRFGIEGRREPDCEEERQEGKHEDSGLR